MWYPKPPLPDVCTLALHKPRETLILIKSSWNIFCAFHKRTLFTVKHRGQCLLKANTWTKKSGWKSNRLKSVHVSWCKLVNHPFFHLQLLNRELREAKSAKMEKMETHVVPEAQTSSQQSSAQNHLPQTPSDMPASAQTASASSPTPPPPAAPPSPPTGPAAPVAPEAPAAYVASEAPAAHVAPPAPPAPAKLHLGPERFHYHNTKL